MSENEKNAVLSIPTPPTSASSSNSSVCSTNIASGSVCLASCNELGTAINVTLVDSHSIEGSNHESVRFFRDNSLQLIDCNVFFLHPFDNSLRTPILMPLKYAYVFQEIQSHFGEYFLSISWSF